MPRMNQTPPPPIPKERLEKIAALQKLNTQLDAMMPQRTWWGGKQVYDCRKCGAIVGDRTTHYNFHLDQMFHETLVALFGVNK